MSHAFNALLLGILGVFSLPAQAAPVVFLDTLHSTTAQADAGDASGSISFDDTIASTLPITSSASAVGSQGDSASAVAFATNQALTASSSATALQASASAVSVSTFSGFFETEEGMLDFSFDFTALGSALGGGTGSVQLLATLEIDGNVIFDQFYSSDASFSQQFALAGAGVGFLDFTLISTVDAVPFGAAFNLASVEFSANVTPVPEPASVAMMLAGLGLVGFMVRRRRA